MYNLTEMEPYIFTKKDLLESNTYAPETSNHIIIDIRQKIVSDILAGDQKPYHFHNGEEVILDINGRRVYFPAYNYMALKYQVHIDRILDIEIDLLSSTFTLEVWRNPYMFLCKLRERIWDALNKSTNK